MLKQQLNSAGYWFVSIYSRDRPLKPVSKTVHALVALAFLGPRPDGHEVRHGPNGKSDNRASQLCYGTHKQNEEDKLRDGSRVARDPDAQCGVDGCERKQEIMQFCRSHYQQQWLLGKKARAKSAV